ncbi:hypothetical protein E2C01_091219 [Portunus trituberculatus]|uniref:Uncharacterized protein n=1 Tax=Portunus trituberculatus TaxID=210409 RepID=A0A5B7JNT4_PORTR|nr:hypothetical protein [Portunus trituberculatus]
MNVKEATQDLTTSPSLNSSSIQSRLCITTHETLRAEMRDEDEEEEEEEEERLKGNKRAKDIRVIERRRKQ